MHTLQSLTAVPRVLSGVNRSPLVSGQSLDRLIVLPRSGAAPVGRPLPAALLTGRA
jgi:hypothetical protein